MKSLHGKTLFITGGSRGIGKAIALRAARDGANVVIAAKTAEPHPKLPGTIYDTAEEIEAAGGNALALQVDIRFEDQVENAVAEAVKEFGGIDILVNNASAISLTGTLDTSMKSFDLMHQINARGSYLCAQKCIPHLLKEENPHILNLSPPLNMQPKWFAKHAAYTLAKYAMSVWVLGMAEEFRGKGLAINALWPKTTIATAAVKNILGGEQLIQRSRTPEIVADAAWAVLTRDAKTCTGNFFIDEEVLRAEGIKEFEHYAVQPGAKLQSDLFV
ncbi:MAG: NAD(P)-dependent oxidoreductase [Chlamydiia bacterium]|nr:NAD(P)-dependent oxidoreductase [Chlamydiia bacterium]